MKWPPRMPGSPEDTDPVVVARSHTRLDTRDVISYFANHARRIIFRPRIPGACRRDAARDSANAAERAPDVWRDRRSLRLQLADCLPTSCCASGCGSCRGRTSRTGDSIRAEHVGVSGLGAASAGVGTPQERCSTSNPKGGAHPPTGGVMAMPRRVTRSAILVATLLVPVRSTGGYLPRSHRRGSD